MARVLVVGAGAIGGLVGALLQEARHDVVLLAQPAHVRAITLDGFRVTGGAYGPPRAVTVRAAPRAPDGFVPDLVLVATKTQDVEAALKEHGDSFDDAPVVALQNGLAQDDLVAAAVGKARAVGAVVALDAQLLRPGESRCDRKGTLLVGAPHPEGDAAARRARDVLADAVRAKLVPDVRGARWTKLLVNLGNVVPALTDKPFQRTARHPLLGRAHVRMIKEGLAVARAESATLRAIPWTSPGLLRAVAALPDAAARRAYALRVAMVLGRKPAYGSTWQSVQRGGSIETDFLNGEVARRGASRGVPTPVNANALRLAREGRKLAADDAGRALLEGAA